MAQGDIYSQHSVIDSSSVLSFQQTGSQEVVIHNIITSGAASIYATDGTNDVLVDSSSDAGSWVGLFLHCNSSSYYKVTNDTGGNITVHADGIITK